jgi:hypothetical protein
MKVGQDFNALMKKLNEATPSARVAFFRKPDNFPLWFFYYFGWKEITSWQWNWLYALSSGKNVLIK